MLVDLVDNEVVGVARRPTINSRRGRTPMNTVGSKTLKQQRRRRPPPAPAAYIVSSAKGHQLLVRRPDGRPMRTRPSGSLVATDRVESVQSYLHIPAT